MKNEIILNAMGKISDELIEDAAIAGKEERPALVRVKWIAMVASVLFLICLMFILNQHPGGFLNWQGGSVESVAYSVVVNGETYWPISFKDRVFFELVPEDAVGLTSENTYRITKDDIGDFIGVVEASGDARLIGASMYHFTKYADSYDIVIMEIGGAYEFYVSNRVSFSSPGSFPDEMDANMEITQ